MTRSLFIFWNTILPVIASIPSRPRSKSSTSCFHTFLNCKTRSMKDEKRYSIIINWKVWSGVIEKKLAFDVSNDYHGPLWSKWLPKLALICSLWKIELQKIFNTNIHFTWLRTRIQLQHSVLIQTGSHFVKTMTSHIQHWACHHTMHVWLNPPTGSDFFYTLHWEGDLLVWCELLRM